MGERIAAQRIDESGSFPLEESVAVEDLSRDKRINVYTGAHRLRD
ncbi:MAG: hypothetical protein ACKVHH_05735 [Candidatus Poseidoniales archaeon]